MKYAKVAVEAANFTFDKEFDYIIPESLEEAAQKGCRVTVPFGIKNKKCLGVIFDVTDHSDGKRLKKISEVLDKSPLLNNEMLSLAAWIKDRTFCTLYEAAKAMLPTGINHKIITSYAANPEADESKIQKFSETEKEIFEFLRKKKVYVKSDSIFKSLGMQNTKQGMLFPYH